MLLGELAKKTKTKKPTLDRYIRLGLIPYSTNPENDYRMFDGEAVTHLNLIRVLRKRPFKRSLEEIKVIFARVPVQDLEAKYRKSATELLHFLNDKHLL